MNKLMSARLLLLILLPFTTHAQSIEVKPSDNPLVIKGWVGDETSFIGNIGLILKGTAEGAPVKLNHQKSDLKTEDGTETIGRQSVGVTGDQTLTPQVLSTYQVRVTGVKEPGEYRGRIDFQLAGQPLNAAVPVEVVLVATVRPALSLLTENDRLQANLVNCNYDCMLAQLLLPAGTFQNTVNLWFEKPAASTLTVNDVTIAVKGEYSRLKLAGDQLKISLDQLVQSQQPTGVNQQVPQHSPPKQGAVVADSSNTNNSPLLTGKKYLTLPVTITSNDIPADHYTGNIYLNVAGQSNALKVPVDLNVRRGPLWPLLILLISILLGRLVKFMQDRGNAIANALESVNRLEIRLRDTHPEDANIIEPMLCAARDLVHQDKAAEATTAVNAIAARLSTLGELRQIQARLTGKETNPAVPPIMSDIRQAREHLRLTQDDKAKALLSKIKDALVELAKTPGVIDTDTDSSDLADTVMRANAASSAMSGLGTVRLSAIRQLANALSMLSGLSDRFRSEATLFLARPILWLALLLGLLALGLKTLYVDNPVFGANPFSDFLGLMFWGLSADVASRTLSGLRINNAGRPASGG